MSGFFYNLGRQLGRRAVPAIRKSKLIYASVAGSEEALRAELILGREMAAELANRTAASADQALAALAGELCQRLSARLRDKRRVFQCAVLADPVPTALALPGGFLFLSDSLAELCERRPEELAFLLGHEMGHVVRGHTWDRMVNETALKAISAVTVRASGSLAKWFHEKGIALLRSAYARDCELEADEFGMRLAAAAGYSAGGAVALLRRLETIAPAGGGPGPYFATHPPPSARLARLAPLGRQLTGGAA